MLRSPQECLTLKRAQHQLRNALLVHRRLTAFRQHESRMHALFTHQHIAQKRSTREH